MHNAPPSPFLQRSMHTALQSGDADVVVVLLIVVNDVVVVGGWVVAVTGAVNVVDFDDMVIEPV